MSSMDDYYNFKVKQLSLLFKSYNSKHILCIIDKEKEFQEYILKW